MPLPLAVLPVISAVRKHWKLAALALLVAAILVQTLRLSYAERRADRLQFELNEAREAIADADRKSRKAIIETGKRIEQVTKPDDSAARRVESAPLPGGCVTPREVLEADI